MARLEEELNRGRAFLGAGREEEATVCLVNVIEIDPDNVAANLLLGERHLLPGGDPARAARHFRRAAELLPSAGAEVGWAHALVQQNRPEQAIWHFDRAARLDGDNPQAAVASGEQLLLAARRSDVRSERRSWALREAEARLKTVAGGTDGPAVAALLLGETRAEQKSLMKARDAFRQALERDEDLTEARIGLADVENMLEHYQQAREAIEPLLKRNDPISPDANIQARAALVLALYGLRDWEAGRGVVRELLAVMKEEIAEPGDLRGISGLIKILDVGFLTEMGRLDEAIAPAEEAIASGGSAVSYGFFSLCAVHTARGDYSSYAETLIRANREYPDGSVGADVQERIQITQLRVAVLCAQRRVEAAYELLRGQCEELPGELELQMELVKLAARERRASIGSEQAKWEHRLRGAVNGTRGVLDKRTRLRSAGLARGALQIFDDDAAGAYKTLLKAIKRDRNSHQAHALLGEAAARLENHDEAAEYFATAVRLSPHTFIYKLALANAYAHLDNSYAAEACYREVLACAPTNVEALVGLGTVLGAREEADPEIYEEAGYQLTEALRAAATMEADLSYQRASIRLSPARRAAVYHQLGCVRTREFDAEVAAGNLVRRRKLLREARDAFAKALQEDSGMFLAKRGKARVDRERWALLSERPKWPLIAVICLLLALITSSFFLHFPELKELSGPTYSALTLGLLVLLMAALYLDRLRSLSVAGVSMEKDVQASIAVRRLGVEANPSLIELLPVFFELPPLPEIGDAEALPEAGPNGVKGPSGQAAQGAAEPEAGHQAAKTAKSGASHV